MDACSKPPDLREQARERLLRQGVDGTRRLTPQEIQHAQHQHEGWACAGAADH